MTISKKEREMRNAAWKILTLRRELKRLTAGIVGPSDLSDEDKKKVRKLLNVIDNKKRFLEKRGVDVVAAIRWAMRNPKKRTNKAARVSKKLNSIRKRQRNLGVGIYELSGPVKTWKN